MTKNVYVHYYYDMQEASSARQDLSVKIHQTLNALNKGEKIPDTLMKQVRPFIKKVPNPDSNQHKKAEMHWVIVDEEVKRAFKRAGFFVLKSDCMADAASALRLYRLRGTIEEGFDQLKNGLNGRRFRVPIVLIEAKRLNFSSPHPCVARFWREMKRRVKVFPHRENPSKSLGIRLKNVQAA